VGMPPPPRAFVGRDREIAAIRALLTKAGSQSTIVTLAGMGGVGKTTTAAALAHDRELTKHFPDGIFWATVGQYPNVMSNYITWARGLGLEIEGEKSQHLVQHALAASLRSRRCLLVLDDVWRSEDAMPYFVGGPLSAKLVTTRVMNVGEELSSPRSAVFVLSSLDTDSALELLRFFDAQVVEEFGDECRELVQDLEGSPLAIQLVGHLLSQQGQAGLTGDKRLKELLQHLATSKFINSALVEDVPTLSGTLRDVLTQSTDNLNVDVRDRFAMLGVFAPAPASFDLEALRWIWKVDDPRGTAMELVRLGLLEQVGDRFQVHDLIVDHARTLLEV